MEDQIIVQACANCGAAGVQSMMTTDRFRYGAEASVELEAQVLMFHCLECGETYTGEQGEQARAAAVFEYIGRLHPKLIAAVKAQHEAIDRLFAILISKTMHSEKPFYPSESGQPWEAIQAGKAVLDEAGVEL